MLRATHPSCRLSYMSDSEGVEQLVCVCVREDLKGKRYSQPSSNSKWFTVSRNGKQPSPSAALISPNTSHLISVNVVGWAGGAFCFDHGTWESWTR